MGKQKHRKKLLLTGGALVLAAAVGAGIWFAAQGSGEPVNVYPFQYIGMTEFWGDNQESYGPVATDKIQTVFLSDTQTVTEMKVQSGDTVKKGDVLFAFDTSLDALTLERKRLDVEKIKVQIKAAEERLQDTKEMVPYEPPGDVVPEATEPDPEDAIKGAYEISGDEKNTTYDGKTQETALICWLKDDTPITDDILQELYETALKYQAENEKNPPVTENTEGDASNASDTPDGTADDQNAQDLQAQEQEETYEIKITFICKDKDVETIRDEDTIKIGPEGYQIRDVYADLGEKKTYWLKSAKYKNGGDLDSLTIDYPKTTENLEEWKAKWKDGVTVEYIRNISVTGGQLKEHTFADLSKDQEIKLEIGKDATFMFQSQMEETPKGASLTFEVSPADGFLMAAHNKDFLLLTGKPEKVTDTPVDYEVTATYSFEDNHGNTMLVKETFPFAVSVVNQTTKGEFYVVFKVTEENYLKATPLTWEGAKVTAYEDGTFGMQLYDASAFADHTLPVSEDEIEIELPEIDPDAMYTAEQILDMQKQLYATIKEQNEKLKTAEFEYDIMQRELGDGNVYAEIDGKVVALLTEEEARANSQPIVKVSGGGGFYIEGSVSELEKEKLQLGQEVTVNDWNTGNTYTGEVVSIGDFPSDRDNWNGMGNPNASYYPFKAFVGEDADLQAGSHVSMSYSTASAQQGIYLEKPFVRSEKGKSYIFVRGTDGRLEKREVQVGKVLWGSYYEILSPLGEEDYLAFPYGKQVKDGAPTVESDISTLYGF